MQGSLTLVTTKSGHPTIAVDDDGAMLETGAGRRPGGNWQNVGIVGCGGPQPSVFGVRLGRSVAQMRFRRRFAKRKSACRTSSMFLVNRVSWLRLPPEARSCRVAGTSVGTIF